MTSWKDFKNWLETNMVEPDGLVMKLKPEKQILYANLTSNALNRFMDSLEATLDNDDTCHPFPGYSPQKSFESLFNPLACYFGKKTNKKRIGSESYQDLKKIFLDWKNEVEIIARLNEGIEKLTIENKCLQEKVTNYKKERGEFVAQKCSEMDGLMSEMKDLKISLSTKNEEINWLKKQLKKALGEEKYKNQIEINYPSKFKK